MRKRLQFFVIILLLSAIAIFCVIQRSQKGAAKEARRPSPLRQRTSRNPSSLLPALTVNDSDLASNVDPGKSTVTPHNAEPERALPDPEEPVLREIYLVAPDTVALVYDDRKVHSFSPTNDWFDLGVNKVIGDEGASYQAFKWKVRKDNGEEIAIDHVYRQSKPNGQRYYETGYKANTHDNLVDVVHYIYLNLAENVGNRRVTFTTPQGDVKFHFDDTVITPVIKVNQVGYSSKGGRRYAYITGYLGDGGPLDLGNFPTQAEIVSNGEVIDTVPITSRAANDAISGGEVRQIDLSSITAKTFQIRIEGVGSSYPTGVNQKKVEEAYKVIAEALYLNRFGCSIDYSDYPSRPADHKTVYTADKMDYLNFFDEDTPKTNPLHITGGHHDAGDFDIRPFHYGVPLTLLNSFQARGNDVQLAIPEAGNTVPDIMDEVLWSVGAWEQLQEPSGGIRLGIESYRHPWGIYYADEDPLPYWTYGIDPLHSMRIAGIFAQAANVIRRYDASKADELLERAKKAYDYASENGIGPKNGEATFLALSELAAAGVPGFDKKLLDAWKANDSKWGGGPELYEQAPWFASYQDAGQPITVQCITGYLLSKRADATIKEQALVRISRQIDEIKKTVDTDTFRHPRPSNYDPDWGNTTNPYKFLHPVVVGLGTNASQDLVDIVSLSVDYIFGCNPLGMVWVTGLGYENPKDILHMDSLAYRHDGYPPLPGFPVYGPVKELQAAEYYDYCRVLFYPSFDKVPLMLRYADCHGLVIMNEFDVGVQAGQTALLGLLQ